MLYHACVQYQITLPVNQPPVWPLRCVGCSSRPPTHTLRVRAQPTLAFAALSGSLAFVFTPTVNFPACQECATKLRSQRLRREFLLWSGYAFGGALAIWLAILLGVYGTSFAKAKLIGLCVLALLPVIAFETFMLPAPVQVTRHFKGLIFSFTDHKYAVHFAVDNDAKIEVSP